MFDPAKLDLPCRDVLVAGALAFLLGVAPTSLAASSGSLAVRTPWCLPARPRANAAGYLVIDNVTDRPDRLTQITSPVARRISIHESRITGGVATMAVLDGVAIPARTTVRFEPGGLHLMLEALRRPLNVGERVPVTLWFQAAGKVRARLIVMLRPPVSAPPAMRM